MDGFTAAWAVRRYFIERGDPEPSMVAAYYPPPGQETVLPSIAGYEVIMVDFCTSREQLLRLKSEAESLIVLDHHKTHREACDGLGFCIFDMERSGAGIAWDHFQSNKSRPWIVDYTEDRDLWRFALPDSKAVNAFVMCQEMTWSCWDRMFDQPLHQAAQNGHGAVMYMKRYALEVGKEARRTFFPKGRYVMLKEGLASGDPDDYYHDVPVVNAPYFGTSELVGSLAQTAEFAVGWFQRADGLYQYSLRSRGEFDVEQVALAFGGGGHKGAAGFVSDQVVSA